MATQKISKSAKTLRNVELLSLLKINKNNGWKTEYIYNKLNKFVDTETEGRVRVTKVKFMEHGKNAACYVE